LWWEDGIGAGLIVDGKLIRGVTYSAGEIGYSEFFPELPFKKSILMDGKSRRWGDILSFTNLNNAVKRGIAEGWKTELNEDSTIDNLIAAAQAKDPLALYIIRLASQLLGIITLNMIYMFNPKVFLLSGVMFNRLPFLEEWVQQYLKNGLLKAPINAVEVKASSLGENGITVGGAALVLEHLFSNNV
jgi:glucokinase